VSEPSRTTEPAFLGAVPALAVSSAPEAADFYVRVLGFMGVHAQPDYAIVSRDDVELHFWTADGPPGSGAEPHLAGSTSCRVQVTGIDALYERYRKERVVHPNAPLHAEPWGTREFAVLDPDGNLVTFYERAG
jgi:catechol 2,3-dioxygenase-like lactoylglutathione lyase family enzyme